MLHVDYLGFIPFNNSICYQSVIAVCLGILISFPRKQCYYWFKLLFLVSFSFIYSLDCLTCCFYICTYGRIAGRSKKALKSPCGPSGHQHKGLQLNVYERLLFWLSNHRISSDHRISKNLTAPLPYYSFYTPPPPFCRMKDFLYFIALVFANIRGRFTQRPLCFGYSSFTHLSSKLFQCLL